MTRQQVAMLAALVLLLAFIPVPYLWGTFQQEDELAEDALPVQEVDIEAPKQALFALSQSPGEQSVKHSWIW